jgi:hypothetical protein
MKRGMMQASLRDKNDRSEMKGEEKEDMGNGYLSCCV